MAFQCVIVTPEHQVLDESVRQAIVPAHDLAIRPWRQGAGQDQRFDCNVNVKRPGT